MKTTNADKADFVQAMKRRSMPLETPRLDDAAAWAVIAKHIEADKRAADRLFWALAAIFVVAVGVVAAISLSQMRDRERPQDVAAECRSRGMQPVEYRGTHDELLSVRCEAVR